ncbi:MAG: outer membrane beta-barrel protein [Deltaproteobacteria bacterium]|nr:outer membrane beta-barrel protein [Deltaproteobacteria bacterium]
MRMFKVCLTVVALAAPLALAHAEEAEMAAAAAPSVTAGLPRDQGWNAGSWALLFELNNVFNQDAILNPFENFGAGVEYFLSPITALRVGAYVGYTTVPAEYTKTTTETGGTPAVTEYTVTVPGGTYTSISNFQATADFLYRLMTNAVAPYAGAGLFFSWNNRSTDYSDDATVTDQLTTVHNFDRRISGGVRGLLGAEWRIHPNFSLYAEYAVNVTLVSQHSTQNSKTTEVTAGGERSVLREKSESQTPAYLGTSALLAHGGQLGLAIHF